MARFNRVRAGSLYHYNPVMIDRCNPPVDIETHDIVRVVNLRGCPKANTGGHAHVVHLGGAFAGLVCVNSLEPLTAAEKASVKRALTPSKYRRPSERFNCDIRRADERGEL